MSLDKDNKGHRDISNKMDATFGGGVIYEKVVRPVVHGTYHAARGLSSGNGAEFARAKDQFSKVGTGEQRTEYLKAHQDAQKKN
jgi:hypothetical protein